MYNAATVGISKFIFHMYFAPTQVKQVQYNHCDVATCICTYHVQQDVKPVKLVHAVYLVLGCN